MFKLLRPRLLHQGAKEELALEAAVLALAVTSKISVAYRSACAVASAATAVAINLLWSLAARRVAGASDGAGSLGQLASCPCGPN